MSLVKTNKSVRVILPKECLYIVCGILNRNETCIINGNIITFNQLRVNDRIKIIGYTKNFFGGYESIGVGMFKIKQMRQDLSSSIQLKIPNDVTNSTMMVSAAIISNAFVQDELDAVTHNMMRAILSLPKEQKEYNQYLYISWQWPCLVPGCMGIPEIGHHTPMWQEILPWLEWHGLACYGKQSYGECNKKELLDVISTSLGAFGYLNGYEQENRDDRSPLWCKKGTSGDCDDMSVCVASLCNSLFKTNSEFATIINTLFSSVRVTVGLARPGNAKEDILHMWPELIFKEDYYDDDRTTILYEKGDPFVIESTGAVSYHGTVPAGSSGPSGYQVVYQGSLTDYKCRYEYQTENKMIILNGDNSKETINIKNNTLEYLSQWTMKPPLLSTVHTFKKPPYGKKILSFSTTKKSTAPSGAVTEKLFPFTDFSVVWIVDDLID